MKNLISKNKNTAILLLFNFFIFLLKIPGLSFKNSSFFLSSALLNRGSLSLGLIPKLNFGNSFYLFISFFIIYIVSLVYLTLFLGKFIDSKKHKNNTLLFALILISTIFQFSFPLYFSSMFFSLFFALTFAIGTALIILSFENKHPLVIITLLILAFALHPIMFVILFPTTIAIFIKNNPPSKDFRNLQITVLIIFYIVSVSLFIMNFVVVSSENLIKMLYELIFISPVISLVFYVFISAIKSKRYDRLYYYLSLFLFVIALPLLFICNSFYVFLSASLGGQITLIVFGYLKDDSYIIKPLEKIKSFFSNNILVFMLFVFYIIYLTFILENNLGFIGNSLRDNYL